MVRGSPTEAAAVTADYQDVGKKSSKPEAATRFRVYVKRGARARYEQLKHESVDLPVDVQWDRRGADRRNENEAPGAELVGLTPRTTDRRTAPSFNFQQADFVVVEVRDGDEER